MKICLLSGGPSGLSGGPDRLEPFSSPQRRTLKKQAISTEDSAMTGIEIVAKLAELQKQYDEAHRPTRPLDAYRRRHAKRHPKLDYDGEAHTSQYHPRG